MRALLRQLEATLEQSSHAEVGGDPALARRESREVLAALTQRTPGDISRASDETAPPALHAAALAAAQRRAFGEPLAYAVGTAAFRHLVLHVDRRVLIPRPETEVVVDEALESTADHPGGIAVDIGTGSGAIALALATEGAFDHVIATDVSADALAVASLNAAAINLPLGKLEFREGADFEPLRGIKARVLVSNPPYIAFEERDALPASVRDWEPSLALFADRAGMARYEVLIAGAPNYLEPAGWLVLELDARRAHATARLARDDGRYSEIRLVPDLTGRDRVLVARVRDDAITTP
jgi:release factor glutamine methyltransferase